MPRWGGAEDLSNKYIRREDRLAPGVSEIGRMVNIGSQSCIYALANSPLFSEVHRRQLGAKMAAFVAKQMVGSKLNAVKECLELSKYARETQDRFKKVYRDEAVSFKCLMGSLMVGRDFIEDKIKNKGNVYCSFRQQRPNS
ncbi:hypothetical protein NPIL_65751 [Nephila pilipes]|uniref:Uncharacterized protein n=1 Tax=Nephila pilipes TaxID=299642 RepID=A0A8X6PSA3_NEPPI|nr:hypothetical protein NPIL_65751 [Nephila pilipes]